MSSTHELWPIFYTELEQEKETFHIAFRLKKMRRVRWTKEDEEMENWYHFFSMVNGIFSTAPVQPGVCIVCGEPRTKSRFPKGEVTKQGCQVFAGNSFKHKIQEKTIPSKISPSENLMNRRWELMPLAAPSQHLGSESIH